jgi:uncharacterized RDD family membrane protein YckC
MVPIKRAHEIMENRRELPSSHFLLEGEYYAGFWMRAAAAFIDYAILWGIGSLLNLMFFSPFYMRISETLGPMGVEFEPLSFFECIAKGGCEIYFYEVMKASSYLFFLVAILYYSLQLSSKFQATLGMRAFDLKIVDEQGQRISFCRAAARYVSSFLSAMILGIGYLMIAFTSRKQALHDMITSVYVIRHPRR